MTTNSIEVIPTKGIYVVSDGGRIAKHLGFKEPIPWQIVAPTVDQIPSSITTMESMISKIIPTGTPATTRGARKTKKKATRKKTRAKKKATRKKAKVAKKTAKKTTKKVAKKTTKGVKKTAKKTAKKAKQTAPKKGSIRELVGNKLLGAHVARLEKAGISTVNALTKKKRAQILAIPGVGEKMVVTIEKCLKKAGLALAG